jgi:hypothetical protein
MAASLELFRAVAKIAAGDMLEECTAFSGLVNIILTGVCGDQRYSESYGQEC